MGRKLYAKGEGFNPTTGIDDVEGLREELDALKGGSGGGGGDTTAIERRLTTAEGEIDTLQADVTAAQSTADDAQTSANRANETANGLVTTVSGLGTRVGNVEFNKADKATTLEGYGITDAYTKTETDQQITLVTTPISKEVEDLTLVVEANEEAIGALETTQESLSSSVKTNSNNIATHTQQITNLSNNKLGKTEKAAAAAKADNATQLGGVAADGYTRVLKGITVTVNKHLYIGTLPASSGSTADSLSIRGSIGGFGVIRRDFVDIAIGRRDGLQFGGLASFRYTGTSSYWDIAVNDAGEVYILLYGQYSAYHIEVSSQQVTIEGVHGRTPTDTNWHYLREELKPFDNITSDTFTTSAYSSAQPTRYAQLYASGMRLFGSLTSGWASGVSCYDGDGNSCGSVAAAYGEMSYTPSFFYYGGTYDNPIIKAYTDGAVEMRSTLTTRGDITAPKITAQVALPSNGILWYGASAGLSSAFTGLSRNIHGSAFLGINASLLDSHALSMASAHVNIGVSGLLMYGNDGTYKNTIMLVTRPTGSAGEAFDPKVYARITIRETGNVGIGTTTPSEKLDVAGNIKASGTMTATATYHSSDERLKSFEEDVEVDLEKINALPKKYFHWTADADGKRQIGTSAQAVREVYPELVSEDKDGYLSVNYAALSVVALKAIDQLAEQNAELERRLARIEKLLNIE